MTGPIIRNNCLEVGQAHTELPKFLFLGCGYVVIENCFTPDDIEHARELIFYFIKKEGKKATHFQGADESKVDLQVRKHFKETGDSPPFLLRNHPYFTHMTTQSASVKL